MYAWLVKTLAPRKVVDATIRNRYLITHSNRAEDAYDRARRIDTMTSEVLQEVEFLGSIPGIAETSLDFKPLIYYVSATYIFPQSGPRSSVTRIVPTNFLEKIDLKLGKRLGIEYPMGSLSVGPNDAIDVSKIGTVLALSLGDPEEARQVISSHIFSGAVQPDDIFILHMAKVEVPVG